MDSIANVLTKIRNATRAGHRYVDVPESNMVKDIVEILKQQGFVEHILVNKEERVMRLFLTFSKSSRKPLIQGIRRVSKPGLRRYVKSSQIPRVRNGLGVVVLSTSRGVMDGKTASQGKVGGEVICYVW